MQTWLAGLTISIELTRRARALDQAAPPLVATVLDSDLAPARQRAVAGPVSQRPLPRLPPQIPARAPATAGDLTVRARLRRPVLRTLHIPIGAFLTGDLRPPLLGFAAGCGALPDLAHQQFVGSFTGQCCSRP